MSITAQALIVELQKLKPDTQVILRDYATANGHSPLTSINSDARYAADLVWCGVVYGLNGTHDDSCMKPEEREALQRQPYCVVLSSAS